MIDSPTPNGLFKVKLSREDLNFSAGHVSTYGDELEGHHGHNYQLSLEFEGELDADSLLVDFRTVKRIARKILGRLNHKTLVPGKHPRLEVKRQGGATVIRLGSEQLELPTRHLVLLDLPNLTSEMLARYFFESILELLPRSQRKRLRRLTVEVIESPGQSASFSSTVD